MIARAIHSHDPNAGAPFVKVDCSGPTAEEIELQLFGVVAKRGSHASPERRSLERIGAHGRLRDADGGILFLENIIDLSARAQARLVRVLRDREVFVADDPEPVSLDIRPIASVDASVDAALEEGRLRPDLYERLSLIRVDVPALRQRREDIPVLATYFLKELCKANGKPIKSLTRPALTLLAALPWRGNAPELRSLLERLILLVPQGLIRLEDVLAHTQLEGSISPSGFDATLRQARARFEHGRIAEAARVLGIQRTNLYRKMRRLNLMRGKTGREA
jgi:DNA-binding NtrC family response regulator